MASTGVANGIDWCCKWHRLVLQMVSTGVANGIDWCCKWHRLVLQMASSVYEREISLAEAQKQNIVKVGQAVRGWHSW